MAQRALLTIRELPPNTAGGSEPQTPDLSWEILQTLAYWLPPQLDEVGIDVLCNESRTLEREEAEQFYDDHRGTDFFLQLIDYMTRYIIMTGKQTIMLQSSNN